MEFLPLELDGKTGAEARRDGTRVAHIVGRLDEAESRGKHHRAHEDGYRTVRADWRSTNLLASRFWPRLGFVPTHIRLRLDVQPTA